MHVLLVEGSNFDGTKGCHGVATGLGDRVLHARTLDDVEPDNMFACFGEGSGLVEHSAVSHSDRHGRRWRRERLALEQDVARYNVS